MKLKDMSPIYVSIFKRKGSEGKNTKTVDGLRGEVPADVLSRLNNDEKALILYFENDFNWFLLTNNRVLDMSNGTYRALVNSDIIEVQPALEEEFKDGIMNKNEFTRLKIKTKDMKYFICTLESGGPFQGFYQVLHFIANGNV